MMRLGKSWLPVLMTASLLSPALAQETAPAAPAGGPLRDVTALCNAVTTYGAVQPAAQPPAPAAARRDAAATAGAPRGARPVPVISIPDAPMLPYQPVETPPPPAGTLYGGISDVAVMPNGHLIVFQRTPQNQLLEFDADGKLLRSFDANIAARPHGLRIDPHGNIWITDGACNTVMKLSPTGDMLMTLGTKGKTGIWDEASGAHLFNQPNDIAFGPKDDVWVVTGHGGTGDPRVLHFDKNGKYINSWSMKHEDGTPATIHSIVLDKKGDLYVADRLTKRILVMSQEGKLLRTIQMKNLVSGLYVDKTGGLWMAAGEDGMIMKIDWDGKVLGWSGKIGNGPNEYTEAHYIAVSPDLKTIYVADSLADRFMKLQKTN